MEGEDYHDNQDEERMSLHSMVPEHNDWSFSFADRDGAVSCVWVLYDESLLPNLTFAHHSKRRMSPMMMWETKSTTKAA